MQVLTANDVKVYNLSAGKSIPEWITSRRRRKLEQNDLGLRRRMQLIQDFDMPDISNTVTVSSDGRFIFASGTYKPFLKCYDVDNLSLKFARGLDADVVKMVVLSDDYSKCVLLEEERYLEMHSAFGRYFRMRIPTFGHDMAFCHELSDLYIVGSSSEIVRLNLEEGKFLEPLVTLSSSLTCCEFNREHQLFVCGTSDGHIEAWDHRSPNRCGILDCALDVQADESSSELSHITSISFKDALHIGVGTNTSHVLLYDIRAGKPLLIKDHQTGLSIKKIDFVPEHRLVLSMDMRLLKVWHESNGKPFAAIEPGFNLNDFCRYPDSGLLFFANEAPKMLQYFVPAIGTAPKWCSFLEAITEELEEAEQPAVYDDYKFVTREQLEEIGLSHLIGTSLLRAYMHGYFMDIRLYNKAKTFMQPFAYENFKQRKIMDKVDAERSLPTLTRKLEKPNLPSVNKKLAAKLLAIQEVDEKTKEKGNDKAACILLDERFDSLFTNSDFQTDENSEQYQLIMSALRRLEEKRCKLLEKKSDNRSGIDNAEKLETRSSLFMEDVELDESASGCSSTTEDTYEGEEDQMDFVEQRQHLATSEKRSSGGGIYPEMTEKKRAAKPRGFDLIELNASDDAKLYLNQEMAGEAANETMVTKRENVAEMIKDKSSISFNGRQMTFKWKPHGTTALEENSVQKQIKHLEERKKLRRGAREITKTLKKPLNFRKH